MQVASPKPQPLEDAVQRHRRGVWRFLRWLGAEPDLADDLAQEVFVQLLRHPPAFGGDELRLAAWLRVVARNAFVSAQRRARSGVPIDDAVAVEAAWQQATGDGTGDRALEALADCLQRLAPAARTVVDLHYRHQVSQRELARLLGRRPAGVQSLLQRARQALGRCIAQRTEEGP